MAKKLWGGRFSKSTASVVDDFNASIDFDKVLYREDIAGSIAHAEMLQSVGIITKKELTAIRAGFKGIKKDIEAGKFEWRKDLEDIHMNLEAELTARIGEAGKRLHTARSRNDQVATDFRLWVRSAIDSLDERLELLQSSLCVWANDNKDVIIPSMTHLQHAMPVSFVHYVLQWVEGLARDRERLVDCRKRVNVSPLGCCALAGTTLPIDRKFTASALGFSAPSANSLDAVGDRDFVIEFLSVMSAVAVRLSRFSEDMILWSSAPFSWITLDDAYSTGSSIMPQKKNPDVFELVRGKTGRVIGSLVTFLTVVKGVSTTYNKDLQEDKECTFDAVATVSICLDVLTEMMPTTRVNADVISASVDTGYVAATALAEHLVSHGVAFREAHEVIGTIVAHCENKKIRLDELSVAQYKAFHKSFAADVLKWASPVGAAKKLCSLGCGSPVFANRELKKWEKKLS